MLSMVRGRGGMSSLLSSPSLAQALRVEPERAQAYEKYRQAYFEPEFLLNKNWKLQARAYFELFKKPSSSSLEPWAYLLRA